MVKFSYSCHKLSPKIINFKPLFEIRGNEVVGLSPEERNELLPDSQLENINFSYKKFSEEFEDLISLGKFKEIEDSLPEDTETF